VRQSLVTKVFALLLAFCCCAPVNAAVDLKADEIIAKHVQSLGKPGMLSGLTTLIAAGPSEFTSVNPAVKGGGKAMVVSDPGNLYFIIKLNSKEYPFEKIGMFKGKVEIPLVNNGARGLLGAFLMEHSKVVSDGLFGGVMSHRWPFLTADSRISQLRKVGDKKVGGKAAYVLEYLPSGSGSGEFSVRLFFDAETFRHVRSEYRREIPIKTPTFGQMNQLADSKLSLTEDFSDFKDVDGVMLPHKYLVSFQANSNAAMFQNTWGINVSNYYFNQKLAPDFFTFEQ
jgi:hypothetical protein